MARPLKKMFNTKPGCFGKFNKDWTLCTKQCNFSSECQVDKIRGEGKQSRKQYGKSPSEAFDNRKVDRRSKESLEDYYERDWEKRMATQGITYVPKSTPKKKVVKRRVFLMPSAPRTRLVLGSVTDVNMAIMFGLYKYGEVVAHMDPSDIADEYDRINKEPSELFREQRLGKLKTAVARHWNSWGEFIQFMEH